MPAHGKPGSGVVDEPTDGFWPRVTTVEKALARSVQIWKLRPRAQRPA